MIRARLAGPEDRAWEGALRRVPHDAFHLPQYAQADAARLGGTALAFLAQDGPRTIVVPLLVRDVPNSGWRDAVSPYGYPGPVGNTIDPAFWHAALELFRSRLAREGIVSCLLRLHPLLPDVTPHLAAVGSVIRHGDTVAIDLTQDAQTIEARMRANHRRDIRRSRANGYDAVFDQWQYSGAFLSMYGETMARVAATDDYLVTEDYLRTLRQGLGDAVHLGTVIADGRPAAASIFLEHGGICSYFLGASRTDALADAPSKVLLDSAWRWAKARGDWALHLGGGVHGRADGSLFHFKLGFAPDRYPFHTARIVADDRAFADLCRLFSADPDDRLGDEFFPPYRSPAAAVSAGGGMPL